VPSTDLIPKASRYLAGFARGVRWPTFPFRWSPCPRQRTGTGLKVPIDAQGDDRMVLVLSDFPFLVCCTPDPAAASKTRRWRCVGLAQQGAGPTGARRTRRPAIPNIGARHGLALRGTGAPHDASADPADAPPLQEHLEMATRLERGNDGGYRRAAHEVAVPVLGSQVRSKARTADGCRTPRLTEAANATPPDTWP
jgi:hypothetical protein